MVSFGSPCKAGRQAARSHPWVEGFDCGNRRGLTRPSNGPKSERWNQALLLAAMSHASQRPGTEVVTLTVTEGNAPAIRLYESAGFQVWGLQPMAIATPSGYKGRVHMWCALAGHARGAAV